MSKSLPTSVLVLALALLGAAACGRRGSVPMVTTTPVLLQSANDPAALRAAIVRALEARRFTTEAENPGQIVASYQNRGQFLRLQIDYGPSEYRLTYLDSAGLGYQQDPRTGNPVIGPHYQRHLVSLQRTIGDEIERPEREAREAVEQQRQHELALAEQQRRSEQDARDAEARERQRDRNARLEEQRLRTEQARAEAEARRPVIINHQPQVVDAMVVAPRVRVRSRFGQVRVGGRIRARWVQGQAEGDIDSGSLGLPASCRGYYAGTPEHLLRVTGDVDYLRLETDAQGDPTLMLVAEDGSVYCDDDGGEGLNSRIEGSFPPGTYRVYVGSYQPRTSATYRMLISAERAAPQAAQVQVAPPAPSRRAAAAPTECRSLVIQMGHSPAQTIHCPGAEPYCADALLRAGHSPAQLIHCRDVQPSCAVTSLRAGHSPAQLIHCR